MNNNQDNAPKQKSDYDKECKTAGIALVILVLICVAIIIFD